MLNFTIASNNPGSNRHGLASPGLPWVIFQEGNQKKEIENCRINGVELSAGERIVFTGGTSNRLSIATVEKYGTQWAICLDWDGNTLTTFPEEKYVKHCSRKIEI